MLPGLLSAGIGALVFTGLGNWTGLEVHALAAPPLPDFARPDLADVLWAVPFGFAAAVLAHAIRVAGRRLLPIVSARPLLVTPAIGALVGALGGPYALITGHPPAEALFSGQQTIVTLIGAPQRWSDAGLVVLIACMGAGYALSLAAFRGGPVFPAVLLGVALGQLLADLPELGRTPAVAMAMAALSVSMLRMPVASIVLVAILLGGAAVAAMPVVILAVVTAFVVTELIDPPASPR